MVDTPNSVTYLNQTPLFEWYMVRCDFKNNNITYMCLKEIGLYAIPNSTINVIGGRGGGLYIYNHSKSTRFFALRMNDIFTRAPKIMTKAARASMWICKAFRTKNRVYFCVQGEEGELEKVTIQDPSICLGGGVWG